MKKSSKKKSFKKFKISNENFKFIKSISIFKLIFSRLIFLKVFKKGLNYDGMNLEMEKNVNFNTIFKIIIIITRFGL
jgi:hypothetical protein